MAATNPGPEADADETRRLAGRLGRLLEVLPAGVVMLDAEGRVGDANPAALELLGSGLVGQRWRAVLEQRFVPAEVGATDARLADGRRVEVRTCPLGTEPGQIVLLTEVTETRVLEERIGRMRRIAAMGDMVAAVAHQIRTPLASALLYASAVRTRIAAGSDAGVVQRACDRIVERLRHLEDLLDDMLGFARQGAFSAERFALARTLRETATALEAQLQDAHATLVLGRVADEAVVDGNREALASAVQNLVLNALEAGGDGTHVELGCAVDGAHALLTVSDDGPGVPEALRERCFEPFFSTRRDGNGLGLAIVRSMVEAHRGTVRVESAPHGGARFVVRLPLATGDAPRGRLERAA